MMKINNDLTTDDFFQFSTSVILIFCNEALSVLLRTVWSLIQYTPRKMLREIVLVKQNKT